MDIKWTSKAFSDLTRLYDFLSPVNRAAAIKAIQSLTSAPLHLSRHPRLGERLDEFAPREVRRLLVGRYEVRYEIKDDTLYVLRVWHSREDR